MEINFVEEMLEFSAHVFSIVLTFDCINEKAGNFYLDQALLVGYRVLERAFSVFYIIHQMLIFTKEIYYGV